MVVGGGGAGGWGGCLGGFTVDTSARRGTNTFHFFSKVSGPGGFLLIYLFIFAWKQQKRDYGHDKACYSYLTVNKYDWLIQQKNCPPRLAPTKSLPSLAFSSLCCSKSFPFSSSGGL